MRFYVLVVIPLVLVVLAAIIATALYIGKHDDAACKSKGLVSFYAHNRALCVDPKTRIVYLP